MTTSRPMLKHWHINYANGSTQLCVLRGDVMFWCEFSDCLQPSKIIVRNLSAHVQWHRTYICFAPLDNWCYLKGQSSCNVWCTFTCLAFQFGTIYMWLLHCRACLQHLESKTKTTTYIYTLWRCINLYSSTLSLTRTTFVAPYYTYIEGSVFCALFVLQCYRTIRLAHWRIAKPICCFCTLRYIFYWHCAAKFNYGAHTYALTK